MITEKELEKIIQTIYVTNPQITQMNIIDVEQKLIEEGLLSPENNNKMFHIGIVFEKEKYEYYLNGSKSSKKEIDKLWQDKEPEQSALEKAREYWSDLRISELRPIQSTLLHAIRKFYEKAIKELQEKENTEQLQPDDTIIAPEG